jgi:hypothetical protein
MTLGTQRLENARSPQHKAVHSDDDLADQLTTAFYVYDTVSSGFTGRERPLTGRPR